MRASCEVVIYIDITAAVKGDAYLDIVVVFSGILQWHITIACCVHVLGVSVELVLKLFFVLLYYI